MPEENLYEHKRGTSSEGEIEWQQDAERILKEAKENGKISKDWTPEQDQKFIEEYTSKMAEIIKNLIG